MDHTSTSLSCSTSKRRSREEKYYRKRRRGKNSHSRDLPSHVMDMIFTRIMYMDLFRARCVSSYWNSMVAEFSKASLKPLQKPIPLLLLPGENQVDDFTYNSGLRLLNLEEQRVFSLTTTTMPEKMKRIKQSCCVGSSHGWLIFLDFVNVELFMINPFRISRSEIPLPSISKFFRKANTSLRNRQLSNICMNSDLAYGYDCIPNYDVKTIRANVIQKAILSSNPAHGDGAFSAVAICGFKSKILSCKGREGEWTMLKGKGRRYYDILCHENRLYALNSQLSIEVWDLAGECPLKGLQIGPRPDHRRGYIYCYSQRFYLVESGGDILLVVRYTACVESAEQQVSEPWLYEIHPFRTNDIRVYKLGPERWERVDCLGNQSLFVGENHSASVVVDEDGVGGGCCKPNSIYFTDDEQRKLSRAGNDMGVYRLQDGKITPFYHFGQQSRKFFHPPPLWILPNLS